MTTRLDDTFAAGLRAGLVDHVQSAARVAPRRRRLRIGALVVAALTLVGGGVSVAAQLLPLPGGEDVRPLAGAVVVSGSGTETISLGVPPAGATRIQIEFSCLTAGSFTFADGAGVVCGAADLGSSAALTSYALPLAAGQDTTTITAAPGTRWRLVAAYAHATTTAWGVNAHGQTYGVVNDRGTPDLVAVVATNGRTGYAYATQLQQAAGPTYTSPADAVAGQQMRTAVTVAVYESDGQTRIGDFVIG